MFQFVVPFMLLLSKDVKRNPRSAAATAVLVLFMRLIDALWTIAPVLRQSEWWDQWLIAALPFGLGGLWLGTSCGN